MIKVTYFFRDSKIGNFSIEELFNSISNALSDKIDSRIWQYDNSKSFINNMFRCFKNKSDVNHITGDVNFLSFALSSRNTIITVHDIGHYENTLKGFKKIIYGLIWIKLPLSKVKYITVISNFTKNQLIKYFRINPNKIRVIHNPISSIFKYQNKEFNKSYPKILQIGSGHNKNLKNLILAVQNLPCQLVLINKLNEEQIHLLKTLNIDYIQLSNLKYEEIYQQYVMCDLVYFASEYEGFGMPIIEAQAVGRVVITSNVASMPEIAGDGAYFVNPYQVSETTIAIKELCNNDNLRSSLIENGLTNVKRFNLEYISNQYLDLYKEICLK